MKISELIHRLEQAIYDYGEAEVLCADTESSIVNESLDYDDEFTPGVYFNLVPPSRTIILHPEEDEF